MSTAGKLIHKRKQYDDVMFISPTVEEEVLDKEAEKEKRRQQYVRTYVSPWERAMRGDESLTATMHHCMAGPHPPHDMPKFKSFNRYCTHIHTNTHMHTNMHAHTHLSNITRFKTFSRLLHLLLCRHVFCTL